MLKIFSRLSKRKRIIAYFFTILFSLLLFEKAVLSPINTKLKKLNAKLSIQEKKLLRFLYVLKQKGLITKEHEKFTEQIKKESSDKETITDLQSCIEKFAKKANLNIVNMQPLDVDTAKFDKRYAIKVSVEASSIRLADFIYQLEKDPQLIRVCEFSLFPKRKDPSILKADMLITRIKLE